MTTEKDLGVNQEDASPAAPLINSKNHEPASVPLLDDEATRARIRFLLTTSPEWGEAGLRLDAETETAMRLPLFAESGEEYENALAALRQRIRELVEEARQQEIAFRNVRDHHEYEGID